MGLITGLLTLPLAPVRATGWLAERLLEQAEAEYYSEERIRELLAEVELERAAGELDPEEADRIEDDLLERLLAGRDLGY